MNKTTAEERDWTGMGPLKVGFLPDFHAHPGCDTRPLKAIGKWFKEEKVDLVVNIGDFVDMESLSSYDKGKAAFEGRRLSKDIEIGKECLDIFHTALGGLDPYIITTLGNHEIRLSRAYNESPELQGVLGDDPFGYEEVGHYVYGYQEMVNLNDVFFSHCAVNPYSVMGSVQGGTAETRLKNLGVSHVVGHTHGNLCMGETVRADGRSISVMVIGCCHVESHAYWGNQTGVFRGAAILDNLNNGQYDPDVKRLTTLLKEFS